MIRKPGKLPGKVNSNSYELEYGTDTLEMQDGKGTVVIVDDVFATGGTMASADILCDISGYEVLDKIAVIDVGLIKQHDTKCLISY
jgi:adenine phosphoribosyltransferase